jgi:hypothetical protein
VTVLSTNSVSERIGVPSYAVRRIIDRHFRNSVERIGGHRVVPLNLVPLIEQKAREAGYLPGVTPRTKQTA